MKESFLLYKSFYEPIKYLSLDEKGLLFDAIYNFQISGIEPENDSKIYMPFLFFKNQFRLDNEKYNLIIERNKINGSQGGRPKKPKKPSGLKKTQTNPKNPDEPKKPDNDNDNEKDNVNENYFKVINHLKITDEENLKLLKLGFSQEKINDIYERIENYRDNKKYTSLFLTAKNWLKLDKSKSNGQSTEQPKYRADLRPL